MFLGHVAVALAAKPLAPRASLGTLTFAALWIDLLWPILLLIGVESVRIEPGAPAGQELFERWGRVSDAENGTTHLSIVDGWGNAVALTATVEAAFGSQRMASGFLLNNQLTDFAFEPTLNGRPVANAAAPGKRPRSSMTPTIITDRDGREGVHASSLPRGGGAPRPAGQ